MIRSRLRGRRRSGLGSAFWAAFLLAGWSLGPGALAADAVQQGAPSADGAPGAEGQARDATTLRALLPGETVTAEIEGPASHHYRFTAGAGEAVRVEAEQEGVNVGLILRSPGGRTLAEGNRPTGSEGRETLLAVTEAAGTHELEVIALVSGERGGYELRLLPLAPASEEEREEASLYAAAWRALDEGQTLRHQARSADALRAAVGRLGEAVGLWDRLEDRDQQGATLNSLGVAYRQLGELSLAEAAYDRALELWRETGNRTGQGDALYNLGRARTAQGRVREALEALEEARALRRGLEDETGEARALARIAAAHLALGELEEARTALEDSLALLRSLGDRRGEASTLNDLGKLHREAGESQAALDSFREALDLYREMGDRRGEIVILNNLGIAYRDLGDDERARELYGEVLAAGRQLEDREGQANALYHLASLDFRTGQNAEALEALEQALALWRDLGNRREEGTALTTLGGVLGDMGRHAEALALTEEALAIAGETEDRRGRFFALLGLGRLHAASGRPPSGEPDADLARARSYLNDALTLARGLGNLAYESLVLTELARLEVPRGDLRRAASLLERAVEHTESLRSRVASEDLRTTYLASSIDRYDLWIDVLMTVHRADPKAGYAAEALAVAERARARGLLDSLARYQAAEGASPDTADLAPEIPQSLRERERRLRRQINARERRRLALLAGDSLGEDGGEAADLSREVGALLSELAEVREEVLRRSPRYGELVEPKPVELGEIQNRLLDPETLLLVYHLGEERSYLWAVTDRSLESFELPPRERIDELAGRAYRLFRAPGDRRPGEPASDPRADDEALAEAAGALAEVILAPVADLRGRSRVAVVPDGSLQVIPFAALPLPRSASARSPSGGSGVAEGPLLRRAEVLSLPSASVLRLIRSDPARPTLGTLAVLGDPVFSPEDPRVRREASATASDEAASRETGEAATIRLPRLRFSRREALEIASLVPEEQRLLALDFDASRELVTSGTLGGYRLVHLATHGFFDHEHPQLSGVALSLVDAGGASREGFLRLHEIYRLRLASDLVTLSACQSAVGIEVEGEGLIGLARGFLYAGSDRVAAGLWRVPDKATAELMERFYRGMLEEGLAPSAALRRAQLALLEGKRWNRPYYWSAFVLLGDWQ